MQAPNGTVEGVIPHAMSLAPGMHLGPYELTVLLATGGMGGVYRARDTRLERDVAIKILPANLSSDPILRQRLEREAKAVSKLNHPHICILHDVGHHGGLDFLVMEMVEGETLEQRLTKGPLQPEQTSRFWSPDGRFIGFFADGNLKKVEASTWLPSNK